jgi:enoyl-[acyl-carrier-protein] reductase (NADH)
MENKKNALIVFGERKPEVREQLIHKFMEQGFNVIEGSANSKLNIYEKVEEINNEYGEIHTCIYVTSPPFETSILDVDFNEKMQNSIYQDLETGTWWIQAVASSMDKFDTKGSIIIITHITSNVPTQKFSYCSTSQAALTNIAKVGALDTQESQIKFNFVAMGWSDDLVEKSFVEQLQEVHKKDKNPLISYTSPKEVAEVCFDLSRMKGINGTTVTVDGGFSITRPIRKMQ